MLNKIKLMSCEFNKGKSDIYVISLDMNGQDLHSELF